MRQQQRIFLWLNRRQQIIQTCIRDLGKNIMTEDPLSPEFRHAICLYRLGRGNYYCNMSEMPGYGVATACCIVVGVSKSIVTNLWGEAVAEHFSKSEAQFKDKLEEMNAEWQFPCAFAAVDGSD